jgi:oligopeptide transport system permease protein
MSKVRDASVFLPADKTVEYDIILRPTVSYWGDAWRRLRANPVAMLSLFLIVIFVYLSIFGPNLRGLDYITINPLDKNLAPSAQYWFGADNKGRDLFSNLWLGLRTSMIIALICCLVQLVVGCLVGGLMAYVGRAFDALFMGVISVIASVPSLLFVMVIMMVLGNGLFSLIVAISITAWCPTARQVRGQILQLRETEFILAAEVLGTGKFTTIFRHLIPNTIGVLIVNVTASIPEYIFMESGLSFIGFGLNPPSVSLGTLLASGQTSMDFHPHELFFPCIVLILVVLAFNLLGDGLRNALDPRLRR